MVQTSEPSADSAGLTGSSVRGSTEYSVRLGHPRDWLTKPLEWKLHWILRIAVAAEFIGHGAFGIMTKQGWVPYYAVFGIPENVAYTMMPLTGAFDITVGLLALFLPFRAVFLHMAVWGFFTALLRPASGESAWEVVERTYNFGVPMMLLLLHGGGGRSLRKWFAIVDTVPRLSRPTARTYTYILQAIVSGFLIGHGALGLLARKGGYLDHYSSIGLTSLVNDPQLLNTIVGSFEIVLGLLVLVVPVAPLLGFIVLWKLGTEGLYITADAYGAGFEVLERGGAYAAPIALYIVQRIGRREATVGESEAAQSQIAAEDDADVSPAKRR